MKKNSVDLLNGNEKDEWLIMKLENKGNSVAVLKPGREKSLLRKHPWVFSGAISHLHGDPQLGDTIKVYSNLGEFLGWGIFSPSSKIRIRIYGWEEKDEINSDLFRRKLKQAIEYRHSMLSLGSTNAFRLVHAESDGIPGLIVDKYHDVLVIQVLSAGIEKWRRDIVAQLMEITGLKTVYERSDVEVRKLEGLPLRQGLISGRLPNDGLVTIIENDLYFKVDIEKGHKTGFYLDQRDNRFFVQKVSLGKRVLDCFCYTGGFTLSALKGGAECVVSIDTSELALQSVRENIGYNQLELPSGSEFIQQDVFHALRKFRDQGRNFDLIILDPPKFAPTVASARNASRGYKDINLLALKLLNKPGRLVTFSCSGGINPELFQKIVAGAAVDAGLHGKISRHLFQSSDHPVSLAFPEGLYLKGFVVDIT